MPLRNVLEAQEETLQQMYLASEARYAEGTALFAQNEYDGSIYLLGLSAEMLLKLALYRLDATAKLTDSVNAGWGAFARAWTRLFPRLKVDGHDLLGLSIVLESEHRRRIGPYDHGLDRDYSRCIGRLYENWWITMRYRGKYALSSEAEQVMEDVNGLRSNHNRLWR